MSKSSAALSFTAVTSASTYPGFYLRNNPSCNGDIPSAGPYGLTPDIIGSAAPIPNASTMLSSQQSWSQSYSTEPVYGQANYYYVRGLNGSAVDVDAQLSLYSAPASLILFPDVWRANALPSESGASTVEVTAAPGHIGVGEGAFVWQSPSVPRYGSDFYSFVAQANDSDNSNPIPTISSWLDMATLQSNNLGFGFRNMASISPTDSIWTRRLALEIPSSLQSSGQVMLMLSASGFQGSTIGFIADVFNDNKQPILLNPTAVGSNSFTTALITTLSPGFSTHIAVQCWGGISAPAAGATITLSALYLIPPSEVIQATSRCVIDSVRDRFLQEAVGVGPQPTAILGSVSFVVAAST
jgi:hypothetical protein